MTEATALAKLWDKTDSAFFAENKDRYAHIRKAYIGESDAEFQSLGPHDRNRRVILLWRVPDDGNPVLAMARQQYPNLLLGRSPILKIPFLLYADETVEDRDDILLPIIDGMMKERQ